MTSALPNSLAKDAFDALLATGTVKAIAVTDASFDKDTWTRRSHITNEVATGGGYTAGGITVTCTTAIDNAGDRVSRTYGDAVWAAPTTFSARGIIYVLVKGGAASADPILDFIDFGVTKTGDGDTFRATVTTPGYANNPS